MFVSNDPQSSQLFLLHGIKKITEELKNTFTRSESGELSIKAEVEDSDLIKLSVEYSTYLKEIIRLGGGMPKENMADYWLMCLEKHFWRSHNFAYTLQHYTSDTLPKASLLGLVEKFRPYEWVRYQLYLLLAVTQTFAVVELQQFFDKLLEEKSELVRLALYRLLLLHLENNPLIESISQRVKEEENPQLIREIAYLLKRDEKLDSDKIKTLFGI